MKGLDVKNIRKKLGLSQTKFGQSLGVSLRTVQNWESTDKELKEKVQILIKQKYTNTQNLHITNIEEADIPKIEVIPNKNGNEFIEIGGGLYLMKVPLLEMPAQASFADSYQDVEFLSGVNEYHSIIVSEVHRGKYVAFRVINDSMVDGTYNSILPNQIVTGRELQRQHWRDKLWYKRRPYWVIGTTESKYPLLKQITNHDVEKGIITCHSLNPEVEDFNLSLNDVSSLFYVVDINKSVTN